MKKLAKTLFIILLSLIVVGYFLFVFKSGPKQQPLIPIFFSQNQSFSNIIEERLTESRPIYVLLLGYGGEGHDGTYLTDSIILAKINPLFQSVTLISVPRDLWAPLPTPAKINHAYFLGGGQLAKAIVSEVTGLKVDRYLALDFSGFTKFVDILGGVDITLNRPFDDYSYPVTGQETAMCGKTWETMTPEEKSSPLDLLPTVFPCRFEHLHLDAGINHLDGTTALKYVRSRHSTVDGTDFGRSVRQRQVIMAVIKKTFSLSTLPKIIPLYQSLKNHIDTDLTPAELATAATHITDLPSYQINGISLTDQNILKNSFSPDGQYILVPTTSPGDWPAIHGWLSTELLKVASPSASPR